MPKRNIREIIDICKETYSLDKIIFISFDYENLVTVRKLLPEQNMQYLTDKCEPDLIDKLKAHDFDLDIGYWLLTEELINTLHENGIKINCWTCDEPDKAKQLVRWGVDYITTNILE